MFKSAILSTSAIKVTCPNQTFLFFFALFHCVKPIIQILDSNSLTPRSLHLLSPLPGKDLYPDFCHNLLLPIIQAQLKCLHFAGLLPGCLPKGSTVISCHVPPQSMLKCSSPTPQHVTLFGNNVVAR